MEQQNNNKSLIAVLIIIIVILAVLCILFATNTISFNSNSVDNGNNQSNGSVIENSNTSNDNTTDNSQVSSSWTSYLLSRHILEAKVTRVRSKDLGDAEDYNKTVTITMDDIKTILSSLENKELQKIWSEGKGGPDRDLLTIPYESNNERYEFRLWNGIIITDKLDDDFITILNNSKSFGADVDDKQKDGAFYFYSISDYTDTIFDKYFK